ncbi:hypothetical protein ACWWD9_02715 [Methylovorus sp. SPW-M1]
MSNINDLYKQSMLAFASYAELAPGVPSLDSLKDARMVESQATIFLNSFNVVEQYSDDATGASATVFEEIGTGVKYLAIRGTESLGDYISDLLLATVALPQLNPQYMVIEAKVAEWISTGILDSSFTITGHSLGGYLATAIGMKFNDNVSNVFTYNSPGFVSLTGNVIDIFKQSFGLGDLALIDGIFNVRGTAGISAISGLGVQLSPPILVETEYNDTLIPNHSIINVTDSLALFDFASQLDPYVTLAKLNNLVKSSGASDELEQENTLDAFRKYFGYTLPTTTREDFWWNLSQLKLIGAASELFGNVEILTSPQSLEDAKNNFESFLSIMFLSPFTLNTESGYFESIHSNLYDKWASDGLLSDEDRLVGLANYSDQFLKDRIAMLGWVNKENFSDYGDLLLSSADVSKPDSYFIDISTNKVIRLGSVFNEDSSRIHYVFGSISSDAIFGGGNQIVCTDWRGLITLSVMLEMIG